MRQAAEERAGPVEGARPCAAQLLLPDGGLTEGSWRREQEKPELWQGVTSVAVVHGKSKDKDDKSLTYFKAVAFQMRLFEYELPGAGRLRALRDRQLRCWRHKVDSCFRLQTP